MVQIGKALHEQKEEALKNKELQIENVKIDGLTDKYLIEIKKSDADVDACIWQILLYLKVLRSKGIERIGKLEFVEKNKQGKKTIFVELTPEKEAELEEHIRHIKELLDKSEVPEVLHKKGCKTCAYYEYCYI